MFSVLSKFFLPLRQVFGVNSEVRHHNTTNILKMLYQFLNMIVECSPIKHKAFFNAKVYGKHVWITTAIEHKEKLNIQK